MMHLNRLNIYLRFLLLKMRHEIEVANFAQII